MAVETVEVVEVVKSAATIAKVGEDIWRTERKRSLKRGRVIKRDVNIVVR
jgi:hypothetical protein